MTSSALLAGLLQASAWLAIALAPPLLLRAPLRRLLGPGIAYAAWLLADGATATPRLRVRNGEPFAVAIGEGAAHWHVASVLAVDEQDGSADVTLALRHGTQPVGEPRLRMKLGETAGVKVDGAYGLSLTVTRSAP